MQKSKSGGHIGLRVQKDMTGHSPHMEPQEPKARSRDVSGGRAMIAVLAYMHTGSTYVGSVFQNHPATYYEYEPLRSLQAMSRRNESTTWLNGTTR